MIRYLSKRTTIRRKARSAGLSHNRRRFPTDAAPHLLFGALFERGERWVFLLCGVATDTSGIIQQPQRVRSIRSCPLSLFGARVERGE